MRRVDCDGVVPGIYEVALDLQREPEEGGRRRRVRVRMMSVICLCFYGMASPSKLHYKAGTKPLLIFSSLIICILAAIPSELE